MALHRQARTQILGALTPANTTLLGSVVSQLAVAPQPIRAPPPRSSMRRCRRARSNPS